MPRKSKGIRCQYNKENLQRAVEAVKSGMSVRKAAGHFQVPKSTLNDRMTGRVAIDASAGLKPVIPAEVENMVAEKVKAAGRMGFGITRQHLCRKVGKLASSLKLRNIFKNGVPGKDWLAGFMKRHPDISLRSPTPLNTVRAKMLNQEVTQKYFHDLGKTVANMCLRNAPQKIWNIDETNVSLTHKPAKVLAEVGQRNVPGRVGNTRDGVTVLACVNAAGKDIPPLVVIKGQTEKSLRAYNVAQGPPGTKYTFQKKAWMNDVLGECWFRDHFLLNCGPERPQLIILDSHSSHETLGLLELAKENNIEIFALPPHTTQYLNPLDKTVFGPFQREYNRQCSDFMSQSPNNLVTKWEWPKLFKAAYIKTFNPENITKGFEVCGIFPFNPERIPETAFAPSQPFDKFQTSSEKSTPSFRKLSATVSAPEDTRVSKEYVALEPAPSSESLTVQTPQYSLPVENNSAIHQSCTAIQAKCMVSSDGVAQQDCTVVASTSSDGVLHLDDPQVLFELISNGTLEVAQESQSDSVDKPLYTEVESIFELPSISAVVKKENKKKLTSHRLLTSDEIILHKQKDKEEKSKIEKQKAERKLMRFLKSEERKKNQQTKKKRSKKGTMSKPMDAASFDQ